MSPKSFVPSPSSFDRGSCLQNRCLPCTQWQTGSCVSLASSSGGLLLPYTHYLLSSNSSGPSRKVQTVYEQQYDLLNPPHPALPIHHRSAKPSVIVPRRRLPPSNIMAYNDKEFDQTVQGCFVRPFPHPVSHPPTGFIISSQAISNCSRILSIFGSSYDTLDDHEAAVVCGPVHFDTRLNTYHLAPFPHGPSSTRPTSVITEATIVMRGAHNRLNKTTTIDTSTRAGKEGGKSHGMCSWDLEWVVASDASRWDGVSEELIQLCSFLFGRDYIVSLSLRRESAGTK